MARPTATLPHRPGGLRRPEEGTGVLLAVLLAVAEATGVLHLPLALLRRVARLADGRRPEAVKGGDADAVARSTDAQIAATSASGAAVADGAILVEAAAGVHLKVALLVGQEADAEARRRRKEDFHAQISAPGGSCSCRRRSSSISRTGRHCCYSGRGGGIFRHWIEDTEGRLEDFVATVKGAHSTPAAASTATTAAAAASGAPKSVARVKRFQRLSFGDCQGKEFAFSFSADWITASGRGGSCSTERGAVSKRCLPSLPEELIGLLWLRGGRGGARGLEGRRRRQGRR